MPVTPHISPAMGGTVFNIIPGLTICAGISCGTGGCTGSDVGTGGGSDVGKVVGMDVGTDDGTDGGAEDSCDVDTDGGCVVGTHIGCDSGTEVAGTDVATDVGIAGGGSDAGIHNCWIDSLGSVGAAPSATQKHVSKQLFRSENKCYQIS